MNKPVIAGVAAIVLLALGGWWYLGQDVAPPEPEPPVEAPLVEAPAVRNPLPVTADQPLPPLADSDQPLLESLAGLVGLDAVRQYLIPKDLIRHIVVTVDNLPRKKLALQLRPVVPIPGQFAVEDGDVPKLSAVNAARYAPAVKIFQAADTQALVKIYLRFYPLFQEAYEGLGYPAQYFNDRLVEVIDHLLATPDLTGPIELARPSLMYVYADPALEALSAGQKTLIRMGHENALAVRKKLKEIRSEIAGKAPAAQ